MAENLATSISSKTASVVINGDKPTTIIGERINPTGRKRVLEALKNGDYSIIKDDAIQQVAAGAQVLDVNAGVPGSNEPQLLERVIREVLEVVDVPLCIDTADPVALKAALSIYQGKPLINSVTGEKNSLNAVLPLVSEHGAAVIGLCMDDDGIPATAQARLKVAEKILNRAANYGIMAEDIIIDPLTMTLGADHSSGQTTLQTIALVASELGVNITMGASNISFGLPDRRYINAAFIAMAIHAGVTCPITNPLVPEIAIAVLAADLSMGRDQYGMNWIKAFRLRQKRALDV